MALLNVCIIQKVWSRLHCLWECSVYGKGGSAHGSPLLIFPMIPCLTLRGLDSALPLAGPDYSPVSIALFDSSSGVLICLRVCKRVPPPHTHTLPKTQCLLWLRRRVSACPSLKTAKTKAKKGRKKNLEERKLRYQVDPMLACLSDSTIYGWVSDAAGAKLTVYTERFPRTSLHK